MPQPALGPIPAGMNTLTTQFYFDGNAGEAVEFYQKAFGAELAGPVALGPDGKAVMHAMLKIGDSNLMMADAWPGSWETGPKDHATSSLWIYVADCDALYERATAAGCEVLMPMDDAFWGDRFGKVKDPFGHCWSIASHKWELTPEEMQARQKEFFEKAPPA